MFIEVRASTFIRTELTFFTALDPLGVNVIGGRIPGIGVAGFTLGGGKILKHFQDGRHLTFAGYSYLTSQYGLAIDNVKEYELVLPNGTVIDVTSSSNPDLFFGLKVRPATSNFRVTSYDESYNVLGRV